jgi:hypothetical protein
MRRSRSRKRLSRSRCGCLGSCRSRFRWGSGPAWAAPVWTYDRNLQTWVRATLEQASIDQGSGRKKIPLLVYVRCYSDQASVESPLVRGGVPPRQARAVVAYYAPNRLGGAGDRGTVHMRAGSSARRRSSRPSRKRSCSGFHAVARLPGQLDEDSVVAAARARSIGLHGMNEFRSNGSTGPPELVLGFGNLTNDAIERAIRDVRDLIRVEQT